MKLLWIGSDFLHPLARPEQRRAFEILRRLHGRHTVHYIAFSRPDEPEGPRRAREYSAKAFPVFRRPPTRFAYSPVPRLASALVPALPGEISRYRSKPMREAISRLILEERYDCVVCGSLAQAVNIDDLERCVLFEHAVETVVYRSQAQSAHPPWRRWFLCQQAERVFRFEQQACRRAQRVAVASRADAQALGQLFGVRDVCHVPDGIDTSYFSPPDRLAAPAADLVFWGRMDHAPDVDAVQYFVRDILPLIRARLPDCTLAIAGGGPGLGVRQLAREDPRIVTAGDMPDVRPYLWGAKASIFPLRIGGGTLPKIREALAAGAPAAATSIAAAGVGAAHPTQIRVADTPEEFGAQCLELLSNEGVRQAAAAAGRAFVEAQWSWDRIAGRFEEAAGAH